MGKIRGILAILFVVALAPAGSILAQGLDPRAGLDRGLMLFSRGDYSGALPAFRMAALADSGTALASDAQYWTILARIALGETSALLPDIEKFRLVYRDSRFTPDLIYQRGRIQFVLGDLMAAYESFKWFVSEAPRTDSLRPSAIFWLGECLYAMDKFELARTVFQSIVRDYRSSVKYEAARYRLETLSQKSRERALLDELDRTRISAALAKLEYAKAAEEYETAISGLRRQISELNARLALLQEKQALSGETAISAPASAGSSAVSVANTAGSGFADSQSGAQGRISDLLAAKAETLDLLEKYIRRMSSEGNR
jgi:hypothetical protein